MQNSRGCFGPARSIEGDQVPEKAIPFYLSGCGHIQTAAVGFDPGAFGAKVPTTASRTGICFKRCREFQQVPIGTAC